jgi:deoxyribodipyrimidine photo-lyase
MEESLEKKQASIHILHGCPIEEIPKLCKKLKVNHVYTNRDYEPYAVDRDHKVAAALEEQDVNFSTYKDTGFFEQGEIETKTGGPYKVYTPYKNRWYEKFNEQDGALSDYKPKLKNLAELENKNSITQLDWHKKLGFKRTEPSLKAGTKEAKRRLTLFGNDIQDYNEARDFPAMEKTSNMSPYIRHGNLSVRDLLRAGMEGKSNGHKIWTSEVIWREFYQQILAEFPHVRKGAFRKEYDSIKWAGGKKEFDAWTQGQTGYPLVDAAMRCLNETGLMHNRLRMVVASFLCKTLLVNWQKGEAYFAEKLLDFDLAANNGGWQWSASSGTDAQPYFRIFNPYSQSAKFDKEGEYIKKWCPELSGFKGKKIHDPSTADMIEQSEANCTIGVDYPFPVVNYKEKREEALAMYKKALKS